jgi:hypothetical protein
VAALRTFINNLQAASTPREKAEILFYNLKNTISNRRDFDTLPGATVEAMIKETL